jgi:hypothetical protein
MKIASLLLYKQEFSKEKDSVKVENRPTHKLEIEASATLDLHDSMVTQCSKYKKVLIERKSCQLHYKVKADKLNFNIHLSAYIFYNNQ